MMVASSERESQRDRLQALGLEAWLLWRLFGGGVVMVAGLDRESLLGGLEQFGVGGGADFVSDRGAGCGAVADEPVAQYAGCR